MSADQPADDIVGRGMTTGAQSVPGLVRRTDRRGRAGRAGGVRLRHGQPGRAPARVRSSARCFPRSTRCRPRCGASRTNTSTRPRTTATRPTSAATSRRTSPCSCAAARTRWGRIPKPSIAVAHQRLQHLHQVGGDLGADVPHPGLHARRAGQPPRGRPDVAGQRRLRSRPRLRRRRSSRS